MEEIGTQVASPIFIRQASFAVGAGGGGSARFCSQHPAPRKRSLPFTQQQQHQQEPSDAWTSKQWEWDSMRFIAKPHECHVPPPPPVMQHRHHARVMQEEQELNTAPTTSGLNNTSKSFHAGEGSDHLRLKLGSDSGSGGKAGDAAGTSTSFNSTDEPVSRPNKRVRSGSPGSATYPMCQVDHCEEDLSHAKDYHRRHKVCEFHSKATKALVSKQMQRFCQQCSRFHPLPEFDEGKRSCRRRLAGHNRRRRKTQPEDAASRVLLPGSSEKGINSDLDIVNLLAVLARAQGNTEDRGSTLPDKDQLLQILAKINALPLPANLAAKLPLFSNLGRSVPNQVPSQNQSHLDENCSPSTMDLLTLLSGTPPVCAPNKMESEPERSSQGSDSEKTNSACSDQAACLNLNSGPAMEFPCIGGERSCSSTQSPVDDSDCCVEEIHPHLPLQLFSSSPEDNCPPKLPASRKYFSSDSSNPSEERSPSYSPTVVQKLFPVKRGTLKQGNTSSDGDGDANSRAIRDAGCNTLLQLFAGSSVGNDVGSIQSFPFQAGYTSSSGSDHSPSSMNSDTQDRTGRIIFKLFDKDPSHLPGTLRTQIHNWLLNSPSEMESYIRPGCVVLTVYVSMSLFSWEQFEDKLLHHVKSLIRDFNTDFWGSGRFLLYTGKQLASHVDGKLRIYKTKRAWRSPELLSVSPLAVVHGQETSLLLRGRNLNVSGIKFHCSHTGDYTVEDVSGPACQEPEYNEINLCNFKVSTTASVLGRCFIEIENGFRITSFPVIIADKPICQELRLLEYDFSEGAKMEDSMSAYYQHGPGRPGSREEVLHFLNELGWLFQRKCNSSLLEGPDYKISRFKFLFIFSVEHDFCSLVKSLLDILLEINLGKEGLNRVSLEMLSEIHLLNRAVKRRCKNMIDLLLNYSIDDSSDTSKHYIFTPNHVGPGGVTPLHLAACAFRSDDLVDALTSDPQEIGLHCWKSLLDANGLSPCAYAAMRNNHSYNRLVAQKLADKETGQVSVSVGNEIEQLWLEVNQDHGPSFHIKRSQKPCSKCAAVAMRYRRIPGSQGLLHRPYIHSMLAIAAVCVCVCLFLRGAPDIGLVEPFMWENLCYGPM
ncbi:squamosa promoter-binding-like protein 14 [Coffea arabica]|uniref:Squamosa promoter-binding-like protein 14 n=1 Tax=Coffea arabica TaxID=13443 RepID=A0A6P6UPV7_COFAR